jgi:hypothetical protein
MKNGIVRKDYPFLGSLCTLLTGRKFEPLKWTVLYRTPAGGSENSSFFFF